MTSQVNLESALLICRPELDQRWGGDCVATMPLSYTLKAY